MKEFMKLLWEATFWGMLPVYLAIIVVISIILIRCMKRGELSSREEFLEKNENHKTEKLYTKVSCISEIYLSICVTIAISPVLAYFNIKYEIYI